MYFVYVLINERNKIYIGQTDNLVNRIKRHNSELKHKKVSYTYKHGKIWKLAYKEEFQTRSEAMKREKELKSYRGREFIKIKINGPIAQR